MQYREEQLGYAAQAGGALFNDLMFKFGADFDAAVSNNGLHFEVGRDLPPPGGGAAPPKQAAKFVDVAASFARAIAGAAHAATTPSLYAAAPEWPMGWNGTTGKIFGAVHADADELARSQEAYALPFAIGARLAAAYAADASVHGGGAGGGQLAAALDGARRAAQLAHLAAREQTALDVGDGAGALRRLIALARSGGGGGGASGAMLDAPIQPSERLTNNNNPKYVNRLLLHVACRNYADDLAAEPALMDELLVLDPQAARVGDAQKWLPLHHLCDRAAEAASALSDSRSTREAGYTRCVARLLAAYPAAATAVTNDESGKWTPLTLLLWRSTDANKERHAVYRGIAAHLIESAPSSVSLQNQAKKYPFEWLQRRIVDVSKAKVPQSAATGAPSAVATIEAENPFTTADFDGTKLRRSAITLFREDLSESVDISKELKVVAPPLRRKLENMHDRSIHQLLLPGDRVLAREREVGNAQLDPATGLPRPFLEMEIEGVRVSDAADGLFALWTAREVAARPGARRGTGEHLDQLLGGARASVTLGPDGGAARRVDGVRLELLRFARSEHVDETFPDIIDSADDTSPAHGLNVAFAHTMDSLQEAHAIIEWACGKPKAHKGPAGESKESDGLDGEMVQEQEQEQEVERETEAELVEAEHEFSPPALPVHWTLGELADGSAFGMVLQAAGVTGAGGKPGSSGGGGGSRGKGGRVFAPLCEFRYSRHSLALPFKPLLRVSANHSARVAVGTKPRRLKNVHVLLHHGGHDDDDDDDDDDNDDDADAAAGGRGSAAGGDGGDAAAAKATTKEPFVAVLCLLEAERVRRALRYVQRREFDTLRARASLCTASGTWLARSQVRQY